MSSLVIFERRNFVVEWNKGAAYSVRDRDDQSVKYYPNEAKALAAAKRKVMRKQSADYHNHPLTREERILQAAYRRMK